LFQGIKNGDYSEVHKRWENRKNEFYASTFTQLAQELTNTQLYFDRDVEIELYAPNTQTHTITLGSCKYTNSKLKKSDLSHLKARAAKAELDANNYILVAKKGFSSELKALKGENLQLLTLKNLKQLLDN
jgi:hypothetical protein